VRDPARPRVAHPMADGAVSIHRIAARTEQPAALVQTALDRARSPTAERIPARQATADGAATIPEIAAQPPSREATRPSRNRSREVIRSSLCESTRPSFRTAAARADRAPDQAMAQAVPQVAPRGRPATAQEPPVARPRIAAEVTATSSSSFVEAE
jgi:hypothetical protein